MGFFFVFTFYIFYAFFLFNDVTSKLNFQNEQLAEAFFKSNKNYNITKEDVVDSLEKCWFNLSHYLINESINKENDFSKDIQIAVNSMKQKLDQLLAVSYSNKQVDTVQASFQWAQSPEHIFLNIKFSHRWSSPGSLQVKDEKIVSQKNTFSFSALSNDSNSPQKKYVINLTLLHDIIESETKYNFASVGKVVVTLKKEKKDIWNRLLLSKEKNPNMHVWWDMKEKYQDSIDEFLKEQENKETEETEKEKKNKHESEHEHKHEHEHEHEPIKTDDNTTESQNKQNGQNGNGKESSEHIDNKQNQGVNLKNNEEL
ncbi:co-chaperone p23, putative [Hepatocystis sp. ex Piliocolobus tephrosceles]|nr:co-chaperone p23, putative [Hepatocystis sp. ex Piliocolobus tephrosceles]